MNNNTVIDLNATKSSHKPYSISLDELHTGLLMSENYRDQISLDDVFFALGVSLPAVQKKLTQPFKSDEAFLQLLAFVHAGLPLFSDVKLRHSYEGDLFDLDPENIFCDLAQFVLLTITANLPHVIELLRLNPVYCHYLDVAEEQIFDQLFSIDVEIKKLEVANRNLENTSSETSKDELDKQKELNKNNKKIKQFKDQIDALVGSGSAFVIKNALLDYSEKSRGASSPRNGMTSVFYWWLSATKYQTDFPLLWSAFENESLNFYVEPRITEITIYEDEISYFDVKKRKFTTRTKEQLRKSFSKAKIAFEADKVNLDFLEGLNPVDEVIRANFEDQLEDLLL